MRTAPTRCPSIVVGEDQLEMRVLLERRLSAHRYRVRTARDGRHIQTLLTRILWFLGQSGGAKWQRQKVGGGLYRGGGLAGRGTEWRLNVPNSGRNGQHRRTFPLLGCPGALCAGDLGFFAHPEPVAFKSVGDLHERREVDGLN